jgi:hypothetical protein
VTPLAASRLPPSGVSTPPVLSRIRLLVDLDGHGLLVAGLVLSFLDEAASSAGFCLPRTGWTSMSWLGITGTTAAGTRADNPATSSGHTVKTPRGAAVRSIDPACGAALWEQAERRSACCFGVKTGPAAGRSASTRAQAHPDRQWLKMPWSRHPAPSRARGAATANSIWPPLGRKQPRTCFGVADRSHLGDEAGAPVAACLSGAWPFRTSAIPWGSSPGSHRSKLA